MLANLPDPTADLYPAKRNEKYVLDRPITDEKINGNYNNFYEFGSAKTIASAAQALKTRPWTVKIDGMVEKPIEIGIDDLIRKMTLEERTYRHRCVEAWSMAIAWTGFPLARLVDFARPLGSAKYLQMETFMDAKMAPGQRKTWFPWPYIEGLTMAEATNELAFLATGAYGHPMAKQHGAPLRLAVPWKYGFKSIKSIVRFTFHRPAAAQLLGSLAGGRIRLLGQRQSGSAASALEPGERGSDRHRRAQADAAVQRLRRIRRRHLQGHGSQRAAVGVTRRRAGFQQSGWARQRHNQPSWAGGCVASVVCADHIWRTQSAVTRFGWLFLGSGRQATKSILGSGSRGSVRGGVAPIGQKKTGVLGVRETALGVLLY